MIGCEDFQDGRRRERIREHAQLVMFWGRFMVAVGGCLALLVLSAWLIGGCP